MPSLVDGNPAACLATLLAVTTSVGATEEFKPPPGCKKRWSEIAQLEASLQGERKIPFEGGEKSAKECNLLTSLVPPEIRRAGQTNVAVIVFDITGSGRVVGQQLVAGRNTQWGEIAQKHVAQWVFEPLVEDGIGITRVGVTVVLIAAPKQECDKVKAPPGTNYEVRMCWSR
ncbi:MAG TPA: hypothetical protein VJT80_06920 [Steroidobacteraceae bacterium]|nr:hypothetical protein [Steroidobacteraceae bacterium]